jgi:hypothetical protein
MIDACFGKILDDAAIRRDPCAVGCTETNTDDKSISHGEMDAMAIIECNAPREKQDIEYALVISDEDSRFSVEILFALHDEFDIQQSTRKVVK